MLALAFRQRLGAPLVMTVVKAAADAGVDLVGIPFSERTPDGGLLLSATDETFTPENPVHLDGATRISRALQHLNATLPLA